VDVVGQIVAYNAGRDPERLQMKYRAMQASAFSFLRGSAHLFYARLRRGGVFKSSPTAWLCGDLHLENFGSFKGDNRLVYFDMNDFDEAALAPVAWDLVRMLTSLRIGANSLSLSTRQAEHLCQVFVDAYSASLSAGKAFWVERDTATGLVRRLLDDLRLRQRSDFLDGRTVRRGKRRLIRLDGRKALPVTAVQRSVVEQFMQGFAQRTPNPDFYEVLDVARRIAGTGSLGVDRYAILVRGKGSPDGNYLLDLKQAMPSSLAARVKVAQPRWDSEAHRVVALQRRIQAVAMAFLQPVTMGQRCYVLRGLQPSEDRVDLSAARHALSGIESTIATMGHIVAWGQLRSSGRQGSATADELVAFAAGKKWRAQLLDAARDSAQHVQRDALTFKQAWNDRVLGV
jgi:uncharacterized protein (DUF2252 family)